MANNTPQSPRPSGEPPALSRRQAVLAARCLLVLALLAVLRFAADLLNSELLAALPISLPVREMRAAGDAAGAVALAAGGAVLLVLGQACGRYRAAGTCRLVCGIYAAAALVVPALPEPLPLSVATPVYFAALAAGVYLEFTAHARVLAGTEDRLARWWRVLWWCTAGLAALVLGALAMLSVSWAAVYLLLTIADWGLLALDLACTATLYRTAGALRRAGAGQDSG